MSTVYEVADRAGVSTATVSRVIHGSNLVHPDTRDRVLAVIEELSYVPDGSAQGLSRRRKDIIGLAALERGVTEVGIEKNSPLFMDELVHAVVPQIDASLGQIQVTGGDGLTVAPGPNPIDLPAMETGQVYRQGVKVTPTADGVLLLGLTVSLKHDEMTESRAFSIPLIVER